MITVRTSGEISTWVVAFYPLRATSVRWARWVPGKYKHVAAFGYCAAARTWVYFDPAIAGLYVRLLPDTEGAQRELAGLTLGADVLTVEARPIEWEKIRFRAPWCCTVFVASLLGLRRGALLPTALWRLLVRQGATILDENKRASPAA